MDDRPIQRSYGQGNKLFDSKAEMEAFIKRFTNRGVRMSVEGYDTSVPEEDIKKALINHFSSCGEVVKVIIPRDPESDLVDRRASIILRGNGAKEKALQLNGTVVGEWNVIVKVYQEEDEETRQYRHSLCVDLYNDERFRFGISVTGYDTSLPADDVKSVLIEHFSSCGEITHVYISTNERLANIYFLEKDAENRAFEFDGSEVRGWKLAVRHVATAGCNSPLGPNETRVGYCIPAHCIEFARENEDKVIAFKKKRGLL